MYNIDSSWNDFLMKNDYSIIINKIREEIFYPSEKDILKFMKNDLSKIKYVLYGKDPYIGYNDNNIPYATGRCFEVNGYYDWQQKTKRTSINNILKALYYSKYVEKRSLSEIKELLLVDEFVLQPHELFDSWESQGVLLLNYALTVGNIAGSHFKYWNYFAINLLNYILEYNPNIKFILWGSDAYKLLSPIIADESKIIRDVHPRLNRFYTENVTFNTIEDIKWCGVSKKS